jgi:hypothetical protein
LFTLSVRAKLKSKSRDLDLPPSPQEISFHLSLAGELRENIVSTAIAPLADALEVVKQLNRNAEKQWLGYASRSLWPHSSSASAALPSVK